MAPELFRTSEMMFLRHFWGCVYVCVCVCVYVYVCVCWSAEENGFAHPEESVFFLPLKAEGGKPPWAVIVFVGSASDLLPVALVALAR